MTRRFAALYAVFALLLAGNATAGPMPSPAPLPSLRVAVSEANGRPFVLYDDQDRFQGGLARDILDHLGRHLALAPTYMNVPRARVEPWLRAGRIDAACFLAPGWVRDAKALRWSPPLFQIQQVIVSPSGAAEVTGPHALFGKRVGTLLNYVYPELGWYFADQRIRRVDAPSLESNIAKLERGRIDAFLFDDVETLYAVEHGALAGNVRIDPLWTARDSVYCAFSPSFAARTDGWSAELQSLAASGQIERWIAAYTGGRRVTGGMPSRALHER